LLVCALRGAGKAQAGRLQEGVWGAGGGGTMERKLTSPPNWMRPTLISTTVPRPLA